MILNENPVIHNSKEHSLEFNWDDSVCDPLIDLEIFDLIRNIQVRI